jgi:hypothetical protein
MRHNPDARTITVDKSKLIDIIKENKAKHIIAYEEAVIAYRKEAKKQLKEQTAALKKGRLDIKINLIQPKNEAAEYDKLITMFEWEVNDQVILSQGEFNEYVHDETPFALSSKILNSHYSRKG